MPACLIPPKGIIAMSLPHVCIIILNYNGVSKFQQLLEKSIESMLRTNYPDKTVVFVDNGSTDSSTDFVRSRFGDALEIVALEKNYGWAQGNNLGYRLKCPSHSKYLAFINNDVIVCEDWLEKIIHVLEKNANIGVAQPVILNPDATIQALGGILGHLGYANLIGANKEGALLEKFKGKQFIYTLYAHGAAIVVRKDLFEKLGGFYPKYFLYYDETDFCIRTWLSGFRVATILNSVVKHFGGATVGAHSPLSVYYINRNALFFIYRFRFGLINFLLSLASRITDLLKYSIKRDRVRTLAIFRGIVDAIKYLGKMDPVVEADRPTAKFVAKMAELYRDYLYLFPDRSLIVDNLYRFSI